MWNKMTKTSIPVILFNSNFNSIILQFQILSAIDRNSACDMCDRVNSEID